MDKERAKNVCEQTWRHLVDKKDLVLRVEVENAEQAEEIMQWMYADDKPMKAKLLSVGWDQNVVSNEEFEVLQKLRGIYGV